MRRLSIALSLVLGMTFTSCVAGPHQLRRSVDDWDQDIYVDSPWLNVVLWIIPVIPLLNFGAGIGDFIVTDGYTFWFKDAFGGEGGTGYHHYAVQSKRYMNSLLSDDGHWLRIEGAK